LLAPFAGNGRGLFRRSHDQPAAASNVAWALAEEIKKEEQMREKQRKKKKRKKKKKKK